MDQEEFKRRTKQFALDVLKVTSELPKDQTANIIAKQLIRSAMSVGANYRAVCRSKSMNDMINKLKIVEEEADECLYWMEILVESGLQKEFILKTVMKEGDEILSMIVASLRTLRLKQKNTLHAANR